MARDPWDGAPVCRVRNTVHTRAWKEAGMVVVITDYARGMGWPVDARSHDDGHAFEPSELTPLNTAARELLAALIEDAAS